MTRKKFIESVGATCKNWSWSWSFVNYEEKFIVFGIEHDKDTERVGKILGADWITTDAGRNQPGFTQAMEHIGLIQNEGYDLHTYPLVYKYQFKDGKRHGQPSIESFEAKLTKKHLRQIGTDYYAAKTDDSISYAEEIPFDEKFLEGNTKIVNVNAYERNGRARQACVEHFGYTCQVCNFDFEKFYGKIGEKYIHVHHINPISQSSGEYEIDPKTDLVPLCPNCHAMIHRTQPEQTLEELRTLIQRNEKLRGKASPHVPFP